MFKIWEELNNDAKTFTFGKIVAAFEKHCFEKATPKGEHCTPNIPERINSNGQFNNHFTK